MRNRLIRLIVALAAILVFSPLALAQRGRGGAGQPAPCVNDWQTPSGCDPRPAPSKFNPRDLSGVWTRVKGAANMGNDIPPMTPLGQAKEDAHKPSYGPRAIVPALGNDPMGKCDPLGLTRNVFLEVANRSFEFVQTADRVLQFFEWAHQYRTIWTDGRQLPKNPEPRWMGYSVGRWEGDTFVVETVGLDERTWADMWGRPHSDAMRVQERYQRGDHRTLQLVVRIEDPKIYTKVWVSGALILALNPEKGMDEKLETFCVPSEEEAFNQRIRNPAAGIK